MDKQLDKTDNIMRFFKCDHLPKPLKDISRPFLATAEWVYQNLPNNEEKYISLRKLLEAKDCAVRAHVAGTPEGTKFGGYKG